MRVVQPPLPRVCLPAALCCSCLPTCCPPGCFSNQPGRGRRRRRRWWWRQQLDTPHAQPKLVGLSRRSANVPIQPSSAAPLGGPFPRGGFGVSFWFVSHFGTGNPLLSPSAASIALRPYLLRNGIIHPGTPWYPQGRFLPTPPWVPETVDKREP